MCWFQCHLCCCGVTSITLVLLVLQVQVVPVFQVSPYMWGQIFEKVVCKNSFHFWWSLVSATTF
jgi:hypothetical protein